jgi:O-antigen/teichoic acid export membrane protein
MAGLRRRIGVLGVAHAVVLGLNFVTWVHLARTLAPEGFGVLTFGTALIAYFILAVVLGFEAIGMREVARAPARVVELASTIVGIRLVLLVFVAALFAVTVGLIPQPELYRSVLLILGLNLVVRATQLNWAFVGLGHVGAQATRDVLAALATAAGAWMLVQESTDLIQAALVTVIPPLVFNAALVAVFARRHGAVLPRYDRDAWRAVLVPALPLAASAFLSEVYYSLDKVMLQFLRTTTEVGLYGAAYKILTLALAPSFVLYQAFFPALSSAHGDRIAMRQRAAAFGRIMLIVGLPIALAGPLLARSIVVYVFGSAYEASAPALALLFVNAGVVYVAMSIGNPLMAWNLERPYMWAIVGGAAGNVILNIALIPSFGLVGAAAATLASELVVLVGLIHAYRRVIPLRYDGNVARIVGAALVGALGVGLLLRTIEMPAPAAALTITASYGLSLWAFGAFRAIGAGWTEIHDVRSDVQTNAGITDEALVSPGVSSVG